MGEGREPTEGRKSGRPRIGPGAHAGAGRSPFRVAFASYVSTVEMDGGLEELRTLGHVEIDDEVYEIFEIGIEHYRVVRGSDRMLIGTFRGSPTSMWLLEPETVSLD